jgi:hypothetical protein
MATYVKQLSNPDQIGLQPPKGLREVSTASTALKNCKLILLQQSRSVSRRHTACDDSLVDRPLCETTEHSPSPSPQERNVRDIQTDQACASRSAGGTMCRTEQVDDTIPAYPATRDGDVESERPVQQPALKRQALEDITDESDDHAEKRRRTNGEI